MASASWPVRFSSSARYDEESDSPIMPVCGDRATTAILLEVVIPVPANGEVAKMRGLSAPSGSAPAGQSRSRRRLANPMPPMTSANTSGANGSLHPAPATSPRSTRSNRPWTPPIPEGLELTVTASPAGRARHQEYRRPGEQWQIPIASELLVDDEAVAIERPAAVGIEHATGKGGAAPHQVSGELGQRRAGRRDRTPAFEQARYAEELDGDRG